MIESNGNLHKCLDCGYTWTSNIVPKRCSKCCISAYYFRKRTHYLKYVDSTTIEVIPKLKERLLRRKPPAESFALVVDGLINNPINTAVIYPNSIKKASIQISKTAHEKLKQIKKENNLPSLSETLWRLL